MDMPLLVSPTNNCAEIIVFRGAFSRHPIQRAVVATEARAVCTIEVAKLYPGGEADTA